ncbi:MAG TPA: EthD family reductase [Rhodanobacter sp.]|nr:EthD family reductase [Rhodanobacter sp.]
MARMLVIYKTPKDPEAFDKHYFDIHIPMAKQLPGLIKYEVSKGPIAALLNASDPYRVGILHFDSMAAIKEAFDSECGRACAADRKFMAPDDKDVQMFLFDDQSV